MISHLNITRSCYILYAVADLISRMHITLIPNIHISLTAGAMDALIKIFAFLRNLNVAIECIKFRNAKYSRQHLPITSDEKDKRKLPKRSLVMNVYK